MSTKQKDSHRSPEAAGRAATGPVVKIDHMGIINAYANGCNGSSSREEVVLVFGLNNVWGRNASEVRETLNSRIIFSPFALERLS